MKNSPDERISLDGGSVAEQLHLRSPEVGQEFEIRQLSAERAQHRPESSAGVFEDVHREDVAQLFDDDADDLDALPTDVDVFGVERRDDDVTKQSVVAINVLDDRRRQPELKQKKIVL